MSGPTKRIPPSVRLWRRVDKQGDTDACWLWQGVTHKTGYGEIRAGENHEYVLIHRFAYEERYGAIPDGLQLDHLCGVKHCVNPAHLEPVTARMNTLRGNNPAAKNARKTHCIHGHPFDKSNTYMKFSASYPHGKRVCRKCRNAQQKTRRQKWVA